MVRLTKLFEIIRHNNNNKYIAIYKDENGISIIYYGSEKNCKEYIFNQQKKILNNKFIHVSKTVKNMK
jgi:hypothetical protein